MRGLFTTRSFTLNTGHALSGVARRTETLHILSGRAWITVEGLPQDYWLSAGDTLTVPHGRLTVIEADMADSRVEMLPHGQSALQRLARRLAGMRGGNAQAPCMNPCSQG